MQMIHVQYAQGNSRNNNWPAGWRTAVTREGRLYYQNDITHETQWVPPTALPPSINIAPAPVPFVTSLPSRSVSPRTSRATTEVEVTEHGTQEAALKLPSFSQLKSKLKSLWDKIPYKEALWWIVGAVIVVNDFLSDCRVAAALNYIRAAIETVGFCAQFECESHKIIASSLGGAAESLYLCALIGLVFELWIKWKRLRYLFNLYCYPKQDWSLHEMTVDRRELLWLWIPLGLSDFFSLTLMMAVAESTTNIVGISGRYLNSITWSLISLLKGTIWTWRTHLSFRKKGVHKCVRTCHCLWSCCLFWYLIVASVIIVTFWLNKHAPYAWLNLRPYEYDTFDQFNNDTNISQTVKNKHALAMNDTLECATVADDDEKQIIYGDIVSAPEFIYNNTECRGLDYIYDVRCMQTNSDSKQRLQCSLTWQYDKDANNETEATCFGPATSNQNDQCTFFIAFETCGSLIISCMDFNFYAGYPEMFVCSNYCSLEATIKYLP